MRVLAKKRHMVIVAPLMRKRRRASTTTRMVIDADGTYLGKYLSNHIHTRRILGEVLLQARQSRLPVFKTKYANVGVQVTTVTFPRGARRPQWRRHRVQPVEDRHPDCQILSSSSRHAVANAYFVGAINAWGRRPVEHRRVLRAELFLRPARTSSSLASRKTELITAELDLDRSRVRNVWQFYRDRRPETYGGFMRVSERTAKYDVECERGGAIRDGDLCVHVLRPRYPLARSPECRVASAQATTAATA